VWIHSLVSEALVATARRRIALAAGAWSGRPSVLRSGGGGIGSRVVVGSRNLLPQNLLLLYREVLRSYL
jgi:hypothetical protein